MKVLVSLLAILVGLFLFLWLGTGGREERSDDARSVVLPEADVATPERDEPARLSPSAGAPRPGEPRSEGRTAIQADPEAAPRPTFSEPAPGGPPRVFGRARGEDGPIAGGTITVVDEHDELIGHADIDREGRFEVRLAHPVERASMRVVARGYSPMEIHLRSVRAGETRDLGNVRLQRGRLIQGKVVGPGGKAVPDAEVSVRSVLGNAPSNQPLLATRSAADGSFRFQDAPLGRTRVVGSAEGFGERSVEVPPGSADVLIELVQALRLQILVADPAGRPVPDAFVRASSRDRGSPAREGRTDDSGELLFADLGAFEWDLRVTAEGYRPTSLTKVEVGRGRAQVVLDPWPCIEGRVLGNDGSPPPPGTFVQALPATAAGRRAAMQGKRTSVDEEGNYRICDVRPADYVVCAQAPEHAPTYSATVRVSLDRTAYSGTMFLRTGGELELFVVSDDTPVAAALAQVFTSPPPAAALWNTTALLPWVAEARTDAGGNARIGNLEQGSKWVLVRTEEHLPQLIGPIDVRDRSLARPETVVLVRGAHVYGRVLEEGVPSSAAVVLIQGAELPSAIQLHTDHDGAYRSPPLPSGGYQLRARPTTGTKRGEGSEPEVVELKGTQEHELDLVL